MLEDKVKKKIEELAKSTRNASYEIAKASTEKKNSLLKTIISAIEESKELILKANKLDLNSIKDKNLTSAFIERMTLDEKKIQQMQKNIEDVINLEDPVGRRELLSSRPNGLNVFKQSIPLGVISIIYESRPNVTSDAAVLCLKSGNATVLRGGSECFNTNSAIIKIIKESLEKSGFSSNCINMIPITDREALKHILTLDEDIDLVIPRGGENLIRFIANFSRIPVIKHYKGVCHVYVDEFADSKKAIEISINSKIQRPGVCNSMETLLIHKKQVPNVLGDILEILEKNKVKVHSTPDVVKMFKDRSIIEIREEDWHEEYLDLEMNIKIVEDIDQAISHIEDYGSLHTESIVTEDIQKAEYFINSVNSSAIMHNASTRFNDGNELGLGAEIGISTTKLHAFGPMGLNELTTKKFVILGEGQIKQNA
jgi:glutamate-5-semialdehyde dehydrogenase